MSACAICGACDETYDYSPEIGAVCVRGECGKRAQRMEREMAMEEREQAHEELDRLMGWEQ